MGLPSTVRQERAEHAIVVEKSAAFRFKGRNNRLGSHMPLEDPLRTSAWDANVFALTNRCDQGFHVSAQAGTAGLRVRRKAICLLS